MEGKALLFKLFGGVDAIPLCIRARDAEDIVRTVELIEPSFGACACREPERHSR